MAASALAVDAIHANRLELAASYAGRAAFATWLRRLVIHHCLSRLERERVRAAIAFPDDDEHAADTAGPSLAAETREERVQLDGWLERLPPDQRAVLVLREVEGLRYHEIAATLGIREGTVMSRLARARERLWSLSRGARREPDERERKASG